MKHITLRIDDDVDETINQLTEVHKITKSEMVRKILHSGVNHLNIENNYLEKIYNLSMQNWSFSKTLLEELTSKEKFDEARRMAKILIDKNIIE